MLNVADNEKVKEIKKASETDNYEDFENEAMENAEEGLEVEEISVSESDVPFDTCHFTESVSFSKSDLSEGQDVTVTDEEQRKNILKEKYLNAVGRRPKCVPYISVFSGEEDQKRVLFFGERRPQEIDKQRKEKWREMIKRNKPAGHNYGRVLHDIRLPSLNDGLVCVRFEETGQSLATSHRNGAVEVRNTYTGEEITRLVTFECKDKLPVRGIRYHPKDGKIIYVGGATGTIQVFDTESSEIIGISENLSQICNLDLSLDGNNLVVTGRDSKITVIDPSTFQIKSVRQRPIIDENIQSNIEEEYHKLRIYGLKCHPNDANVFVTGSWDGSVKIWDFRVPGAILSIKGPQVNGDGLDVMGNQILTASWRSENSVQIWEYSSGKLLKHIRDSFKDGRIRSGLIAVGGNGFHEVSVLDINTGKVVAFFPSHKAISSLDTLGNIVAYGGKESLFRIAEVLLPKREF